MVHRLIFLRIILAGRICTVIGENTFAAVLGKPQTDIGMFGVILVKPCFIVRVFAAVPAEVVIIALDICNAVHRTVDRRHGYMRNRGETGRV